jgi:hypothetical protein
MQGFFCCWFALTAFDINFQCDHDSVIVELVKRFPNLQASYLAHTQGKKHQSNLARRAAKEAKEAPVQPAPAKVHTTSVADPGENLSADPDADS